jgi:predicted anti-sigma-YlaC factor YlaD
VDDESVVAGFHCGEVLADLSEHLDGRLSREQALRISEHLQSCDGCRRLGDDIAALVRALRELPEKTLPPEVETRLLAVLGAEEPVHPSIEEIQ